MIFTLRHLKALPEEAYRIGPKAFTYRVWDQAARASGLDVAMRPIRQVDESFLKASDDGAPQGDYGQWWLRQPQRFFVHGVEQYDLNGWLNETESAELLETARRASQGEILAFRGWRAGFGAPPEWDLNPTNQRRWPHQAHSRRVLNAANRRDVGDIKYTWEIGRFLHVTDVVRGYLACRDESLLDGLFAQIEDFDANNPWNQGPHWLSEQEVAIRVGMFCFLLSALRGEEALTHQREFALLLRQIAAGAEYCYRDIHLARCCINNNHLLGGLLGFYLPACLFPWHSHAAKWLSRGRRLLLHAIRTQWWKDGGYTQPSHNYHRLALSYLLWFLRLAEIQGDGELCLAIEEKLGDALSLLLAVMDQRTGKLPNWGPNDGALFCSWTACEYSDFRPLVTSLRYAVDQRRQFESGPWDEQLFWLWGPSAVAAPHAPAEATKTSFPLAGLHVMGAQDDRLVFRCGPVLSRYGQQADQLHVDLRWRGENVLLDTGSCSYGDHQRHEWFRSTDAHNTVVVDGQSQMQPHRQFLFLKWPKVRFCDLPHPPTGVVGWRAGQHDGYRRLRRPVRHSRLVVELPESVWLIIDRLSAPAGEQVSVAARWHFLDAEAELDPHRVTLDYSVGRFALHWKATHPTTPSFVRGHEESVDGWSSQIYGARTPIGSLRVLTQLPGDSRQAILATVMGAAEELPSIEIDETRQAVRCGDVEIKLDSLDL